MSLAFRRTRRLSDRTSVNLSPGGPSVSWRLGPFVVSSRGRWSLRLGRGWGWRR